MKFRIAFHDDHVSGRVLVCLSGFVSKSYIELATERSVCVQFSTKSSVLFNLMAQRARLHNTHVIHTTIKRHTLTNNQMSQLHWLCAIVCAFQFRKKSERTTTFDIRNEVELFLFHF